MNRYVVHIYVNGHDKVVKVDAMTENAARKKAADAHPNARIIDVKLDTGFELAAQVISAVISLASKKKVSVPSNAVKLSFQFMDEVERQVNQLRKKTDEVVHDILNRLSS